MANATFHDQLRPEGRPVTLATTAAGYEIRGDDGLLVAFWSRNDSIREPMGKFTTRLKCHADPFTYLVLKQSPANKHRPFLRKAAMTVALGLGVSLAGAVTIAFERDKPHNWPECKGPAGLAALNVLSARLAAPLPPELRPRKITVVDTPSRNILTTADGSFLVPQDLIASAINPDVLVLELARAMARDNIPADTLLKFNSPALSNDQWAAIQRVCGS